MAKGLEKELCVFVSIYLALLRKNGCEFCGHKPLPGSRSLRHLHTTHKESGGPGICMFRGADYLVYVCVCACVQVIRV